MTYLRYKPCLTGSGKIYLRLSCLLDSLRFDNLAVFWED